MYRAEAIITLKPNKMESIKKFVFVSRKDKQINIIVYSTCEINAKWQLEQHVKNLEDFRREY